MLEIRPNTESFVKAVKEKTIINPNTSSYDTLVCAVADKLFVARLHFLISIAKLFTSFLTKYQNDELMIPFLVTDLKYLIYCVMIRFIKQSCLYENKEVEDKNNWVSFSEVDVGLGRETVLKGLTKCKTFNACDVCD